MNTNPLLWLRLGDAGNYRSFDSIEEVDLGTTFERGDEFDGWVPAGFRVSPDYLGNNYVSCYWGDANANLVRELNAEERTLVESLVAKAAGGR